ncbi:MAG: ubiquinol-cytochrome c reductase iron-sulfur subunit [Thermoanaerobaculia bacterium]
MKMTRRDLLNFLMSLTGTGILATVLYPLIKFISPPKGQEASLSSVSAGKVGDLKPNSAKIFKFGAKPGILILTQNNEYKAFSATCTHLNCIVQYKEDAQIIWCACHNGKYDLQGRNISGPPPKPLEEFEVFLKDDEIFVRRKG